MRFFVALLALIISLQTLAQYNTNEPFFARKLMLKGFPYSTAAIKINGQPASYADLLKVSEPTFLKVELYDKKAAIGQLGYKEGKYGLILMTTRTIQPFKYPIVTTSDSAKYFVKQGDTIYSKATSIPTIDSDTTNKAWIKFLQQNLKSMVPSDNGAPPGMYKVIVKFIVNTDGTLSDIAVDEDPGYGTGAEVLRMMYNSPLWQPALYNGRPVKCIGKQSVTFLVSEEM